MKKMRFNLLPFLISFIIPIVISIAGYSTQSNDSLLIPQFSIKSGFYSEPFDVIVSSKIPLSSIKYTLDCSDPVNSATTITKNSPATIHIDPESSDGQRAKTAAVILRVFIKSENSVAGESVTQSYIFINKVTSLSPDAQRPGSMWPNAAVSSNPQMIDYGMDPDIINNSRYKDLIDDALLAIPSVSITTDLKNLFNTKTGIYMNAGQDGAAWERPASFELIYPSGREGVQINCGLRIRGGASRSGANPKHAFRLFFRSEYGKAKLKYPLFNDEGVDEFDNIDLRTSQNYSWSFPGHMGEYNTMNRDVYSRDMSREMGEPYTRSRYYHLYLNGYYWGLYQTQERPEASFAESYFGGSKDDYDVIKADDGWPSPVYATDGNLNAYLEIWNACQTGFQIDANYFKIQGMNEDGTKNLSYKKLVDIDNLIDFMLVIFFTGNFDCPSSKFYNNNTPRNFYGIFNRKNSAGFKFFQHDAEHALRTTAGEGPGIGVYENRVNICDLPSTDSYRMIVTNSTYFHPQWIHYKLSSNSEYKIKFADHIYKYFFNNGCMTPEKAGSLFSSRAKEIEMAIIAESARWGDTYRHPARNKDDDWLWAVNDILKNYFPKRTDIVLSQLKQAGLYSNLAPPIFKNNDSELTSSSLKVANGFVLKIEKPANQGGVIEYTLNGEDPRLIGGIASTASMNGGTQIEIPITKTTVVKSRIRNVKNWSALHEIILFANNDVSSIKLTEIHYHPSDSDSSNENDFEFLELKNTGKEPIELSGSKFIEGIDYSFPPATIIYPNQFILLASNREKFNERYGFYPFAQYSGQLDNSGEKITFVNSMNELIFSVTYDDKNPWPESADGHGYSLVPKEINSTEDLNNPNNWRPSLFKDGSPGRDDLPSTAIKSVKQNFPREFNLDQNYPNPFNPETIINYQISAISHVTLKVYDLLGREIKTLVDEIKQPGIYHSSFSIKHSALATGIYFYKLTAGEYSSVKKMLLMK